MQLQKDSSLHVQTYARMRVVVLAGINKCSRGGKTDRQTDKVLKTEEREMRIKRKVSTDTHRKQ